MTGLFSLSGCDTNSMDDRIFLTFTFSVDLNGDPIRFAFSSDDIQRGAFRTFSCDCLLDIEPFLASRSFSKAELLEARVTSVRLKSFFPIGQQLDFLHEVELILDANGTGAVTVAEDDTFPSAREIALSVFPGRSISALLVQPQFTIDLRIDPSNVTPDTQYELGIDMTIELEMEGF